MPLPDRPLTTHDIESLESLFKPGLDLSRVKGVVYFDGWSSHEEHQGVFIFRAQDDTLQQVDYGYRPEVGVDSVFEPALVTEEEAEQEIVAMEAYLKVHHSEAGLDI